MELQDMLNEISRMKIENDKLTRVKERQKEISERLKAMSEELASIAEQADPEVKIRERITRTREPDKALMYDNIHKMMLSGQIITRELLRGLFPGKEESDIGNIMTTIKNWPNVINEKTDGTSQLSIRSERYKTQPRIEKVTEKSNEEERGI